MLKWFLCIRVCLTFIIWGKWPMFSVVFLFFLMCFFIVMKVRNPRKSTTATQYKALNKYVCRMHITSHYVTKKHPGTKTTAAMAKKVHLQVRVGTPLFLYKVTAPNS